MDKSNPCGLPGMLNGMLNGMQRLVLTEKLSVFSKKNAFEKKSKPAKYSIPGIPLASHGYKIEICELSAFTGKKFI